MLKDNMEELFELILEDEEDGVFANSFVAAGAIERDFVYFSNQIQFAEVSEEKRLVCGPMLIPNQKILRINEDGERYYVYFSEETIEGVARKFMKNGFGNQVTAEHGSKVSGVYLTELWLVEQPTRDKSNAYGFTLPKGTLFAVYKVENEQMWQKVKDGTFNGYSIEGLFEHRKSDLKLTLETELEDLTEDEATILLTKIKLLFESYSDYGSGVRGNAKRGIELNEKNGNKCATQVGKIRAQQIANGEKLSLETIKRMYSFLSRAETYYDESDMNACGTISFLLWGGKAGLSYSRNKLRELGEIQLKEGVPHYTADGKLYEGPTHKDAEGRLMTGETHTEDSEYLYHKEQFAVIGPRGGIVKAPKAPNSDTPNKNPKGVGTAKGDASGKSAKVSAEDEKTLQNKVDDFNKKDSNTKNGRATLGQLKSVFQRGLGAFNTSSSPVIKSASAWAFARVNAYLFLLKNGRPENKAYITDNDLLPKTHPKASDKLEAQPSISSSYPGEVSKKKKDDK